MAPSPHRVLGPCLLACDRGGISTYLMPFPQPALSIIIIPPRSQRNWPGIGPSPRSEVHTSPSHNINAFPPTSISLAPASNRCPSTYPIDRTSPADHAPAPTWTLYSRYRLPNMSFIPSMSREHTNTRVQKELHRNHKHVRVATNLHNRIVS